MHNVGVRLEELFHFLELVREQNVTRAAEALSMTQPALSRSLARLEGGLGIELFDRDGKRLRLNRFGEILAPHAARIVSEFDDARARISALKSPDTGVVSLAYVTSFGSWLVPSLVKNYQELFPDVRFLLAGGPADGVLDAVRSGGADVGFLSPRPTADDVAWTELTEETLVLSLATEHPLSSRSTIMPEDFDGLELVSLKSEFGLRQITDQYLTDIGTNARIVLEATEIPSMRAMAATGTVAAITPFEPLSPAITQIPLAVPLHRPVGMITSTSRVLDAASAQFARFAREEHNG